MIINFNSAFSIGILIIICLIVMKFFKTIFNMSFIGFILSLVSYFVYDYIFMTIPVVATVSFIFSICGLSKSTIFGKIFAVFGILISVYIILNNYGMI